MDRVYPFLISGALIVLSLAVTAGLDRKIREYVTKSDTALTYEGVPVHLQPGALQNVIYYWIDFSQSLSLLVGPVLGIAIFVDLSNDWLLVAYLSAIAFGIGMCVRMAFRSDMSTYEARRGKLGITSINLAAFAVNAAAGFVAYFLGAPPTHPPG